MDTVHNGLPTSAPAGSEEKVRIMMIRARLRLPLFHPLDASEKVDQPGNVGHTKPSKKRSTRPNRYIRKHKGAFQVCVERQGFLHYLGRYKTFEDAVAARDAFLQQLGELQEAG